jgi:hypothetical protein
MKAKRMLRALCLSVLSVQLWAQAPASADTKPANAPAVQAASADDLQQLKERIAQQEEAIKKLQDSLNQQRTMLEQAVKAQSEQKQQTAAATPAAAAGETAQVIPVSNIVKTAGPRIGQKSDSAPAPSPLSISIGNSTFTPLGFMDATYFWRSTNVGSGIGTNFAGLPLNNAVGGHLSENNFSAQNSRLGMRVDSKFMGWNVLGYLEADFLFNNNSNSVQVGSNSVGFRLRNYFVDASNGKFEVMGGQDWSMLTPNRKGLSPIPGDIFYTQNMDTNYQIGLVWTRAPQFRFVYHPNDHLAWGFALENPQQYIGGANGSGAITLPAAFASSTGSVNPTTGVFTPGSVSSVQGQFNFGPGTANNLFANTSSNVPNLMPDIQTKIAFDGTPGGRAVHFEVAGFLRGFKDYILPSIGGITAPGSHTAFGGGGEVNSNWEIFKNFKLVENLFFSDGGGRYVFGSAPDLVLRANGDISLVHTHSTVDGIEAQVSKNTLLGFYYGGLFIGKNVSVDANGKPVGYGFTGSGATQNRYIQELTFDWVQTLWKNKNYGALALINQYSYIFREPWYVASPNPKQAHDSTVYVNLRYTLP